MERIIENNCWTIKDVERITKLEVIDYSIHNGIWIVCLLENGVTFRFRNW